MIFAGRKGVANSLENNQDEGEGDLTCLLVQVNMFLIPVSTIKCQHIFSLNKGLGYFLSKFAWLKISESLEHT